MEWNQIISLSIFLILVVVEYIRPGTISSK